MHGSWYSCALDKSITIAFKALQIDHFQPFDTSFHRVELPKEAVDSYWHSLTSHFTWN